MNVFGYIRVSGVGQVDKDGPVRQKESIESFCAKHGLHPITVYIEGGVSGTTEAMDRPEFAKMLERAALLASEPALAVNAIVVERMDRLARDLMVSEFLLRECRERNIKVFCADQGELVDMASDSGDPTRTMLRQILGSIAQWDKSVTVRKLRAARNRARDGGRKCEGAKLYGFYPKEKIVLERIAIWLDNGDSYAEIAAALNKAGNRTRFGKLWTKQNLIMVHQQRRAVHKTSMV